MVLFGVEEAAQNAPHLVRHNIEPSVANAVQRMHADIRCEGQCARRLVHQIVVRIDQQDGLGDVRYFFPKWIVKGCTVTPPRYGSATQPLGKMRAMMSRGTRAP